MSEAEQARRDAALRQVQAFADREGFPLEYQELDKDGRVDFIGKAPDGRLFDVAYLKDA